MSSNSAYDQMIAQYKKSQEKSTSTTSSFNSEENLKNYFSIWMPEGVNEKNFKVRILPSADGSSPFTVTHMHSLPRPPYTKFLCSNSYNGDDCPFCEAREMMLKGDANEKKMSWDFRQKDYFVVKVIDREHESDGPKFWRFASNSKGQGIFDKIMAIVQLLGPTIDITDVVNGFDLVISAQRDSKNKRQFNVTSIMAVPTGASVLSENADLVKNWLEDSRTWKDVYKPKTYEYMTLVIEGKTPIWDKEKKIFVAKEDVTTDTENTDTESDIKNLVADQNNNNFNSPVEVISSDSSFDEHDDVPF